MRLVGANQAAVVVGLDPLPGKTNYFIGNDPKKWHRGVAQYARVEYRGVYPGVSLIYYGRQGQLEHDFVVAPGADPRRIRLGFEGAKKLRLDAEGNLVLMTREGEVTLRAPVIYQEVDGVRARVSGRYVLKGKRRVGFDVDSYDRLRPLVIDPVLVYSTYLGGNNYEVGYRIAVDASGSAYVTGTTGSTDFPTAGAYQPYRGSWDVFVTKLDPSGASLGYSTYLGGGDGEEGLGIAIDPTGNAYVTGWTTSADFPTTPGAYQPTFGGRRDGFVTKLEPTGSLMYSTYLGSDEEEFVRGIAVDNNGSAYVAGENGDAFIAKFDPAGAALVYFKQFGGPDVDRAWAIAVDTDGAAYAVGSAGSGFPTTGGAFDTTHNGTDDAFAVKLDATGSTFIYSTYLGGSSGEEARGVALDAAGNAYVVGHTLSADFPITAGAFDTTWGELDAFVTKLSATGSAIIYSTYLGGSDYEFGFGIAVDSSGAAYVTGHTLSNDLPTTGDAFDATYNGGGDAFMSKLNAAGSSLTYSTYLGGSLSPPEQSFFTGFDQGLGIALDSAGSAYVTGQTYSTDFPTVGAYQTYQAAPDAFIVKLSSPISCGVPSFAPASRYTVGSNARFVAVADFNADGVLDLAVAGQTSNDVSVLLGTGTGSFDAAASFGVAPNPHSVAAADLNGDGRPDLVVASRISSSNVSVLLNDGAGGFGPAATLTAGNGPTPVAIADFNEDGKADLAVGNFDSGNVSLLMGNGIGGFSAPTNFSVSGGPHSLAVGDFNQDGHLDLAVANLDSRVSVLLGDGTGNFGAALDFSAGSQPVSVVAGDFDEDGDLDLAVANYGSTFVSILLGNGDGSFAAPANYPVDGVSGGIAAGDFNRDGNSDLAVANWADSNVSILMGNGSGGFSAATNFVVGSASSVSVAVGDFNGDGRNDLAYADYASNSVSILLNTSPCVVADLAITKDDGRNVVSPGQAVTYTITVTNDGPDAVTGATVVDTLPAELSGATWTCSASAGGACTANGSGSINDTAVDLPAGAVATYSLTATVAASASGTLSNTASVAIPSNTVDPTPNNTATDSDTVVAANPDLLETAVSKPPGVAAPGSGFAVTDTVQNQGTLAAGSSRTRYYLSADTQKDAGDKLLGGSRLVAGLGPGATSTGTVTVTIPTNTGLGTYYLLACADDLMNVSETDETNNCLASATTIVVSRPDLIETAVSNPPATASPGTGFGVTDTVQNQGVLAAGSSRTRYYLSADTQRDVGDKLLSGSRLVAGLGAGAMSTGTVTVTIPTNTGLGTYYLLACADDQTSVIETDETNNCLASAATMVLSRPDLVETAVSNPPATGSPGTTFAVTDTAQNQGGIAAGTSTTRYYLSTDTQKNVGDKLLSGSRPVAGLGPGAMSTGTVTVTIPNNTVLGTYYLLACADDQSSVIESNETNNCLASATTIVVTRPDLVETAVSNPPATAQRGSGFTVTDTVTNQGGIAAGTSTTRYYLSTDTQKNAGDKLLSGTRPVAGLGPGATSTGTVTVTIPNNTGLATYYLLACADDTTNVPESNEANNCLASAAQITVTP
jgi:uncharacterized repeat protein (TIGR01451 family)